MEKKGREGGGGGGGFKASCVMVHVLRTEKLGKRECNALFLL